MFVPRKLNVVYSCAGERIGAEATLPYLSPELRGDKLLVGANFASAGVGVLNDTGVQFVSCYFFHLFTSSVYFTFIVQKLLLHVL